MHPTRDQIEAAAYRRWQRRGARHGRDREDWTAAEQDLTFALNYRWVARFPLNVPASVGKPESGHRLRCRFCEQAAPVAVFTPGPLALPAEFGRCAVLVWDECDECRSAADSALADAFESFTRPFLASGPVLPQAGAGIPVAALKALVRTGISVLPPAELQHFGDTLEWLANADQARDAALARQAGFGCRVYVAPTALPTSFVQLARRAQDDGTWPYMLIFLGAGRVVFQTHLPLCPRDEDLDDAPVRSAVLSMSVGEGKSLRASPSAFLPVATQSEVSQGPCPVPGGRSSG